MSRAIPKFFPEKIFFVFFHRVIDNFPALVYNIHIRGIKIPYRLNHGRKLCFTQKKKYLTL